MARNGRLSALKEKGSNQSLKVASDKQSGHDAFVLSLLFPVT